MSEGSGIQAAEEPVQARGLNPKNHPQKERYHLVWRAAALIALLMTGYVWWTHNYGEGLAGVPVIATLAAAFSFAMELLDESSKNDAKKWLANSLLSLIVLVPGYILLAVLLCSLAPVIVLNPGNDPLQVVLSSAESTRSGTDTRTADKDKPARFRIWATPLGRTFIVKVQGYAPKPVEVTAPTGLTVSPERDLTPQVSLLMRPTADGMVELLSGGTLHLMI